jgi:hypothetical protein
MDLDEVAYCGDGEGAFDLHGKLALRIDRGGLDCGGLGEQGLAEEEASGCVYSCALWVGESSSVRAGVSVEMTLPGD